MNETSAGAQERVDLVGLMDGGLVTAWQADPVAGTTYDNIVVRQYLPSDQIISGTAGDDPLIGSAGDDTISGGIGNDVLEGGAGDDTFLFDRGDGADLLRNHGEGTSNDLISFGADIAQDQVWFRQVSDDLEVSVIGTEGKITVDDWYAGEAHRVATLEAGDGAELSASNVQALVDALAAFSPPALGETELSQALHNELDVVIAGAWQSAGS